MLAERLRMLLPYFKTSYNNLPSTQQHQQNSESVGETNTPDRPLNP